MKLSITMLASSCLLLASLSGNVYSDSKGEADDPHAAHKAMAAIASGKSSQAEVTIPEGLTLVNQYGEDVDLDRDIIGDRIVVIDFVYTTCTTVCPVVSSIFSMVQDRLGDRMNREVALITITVDPSRDTPHRLLSYSKNFNPGDGWSWLTGDKKSVDKILTALGAYTPNFEDHPAMVLVGDEQSSEWYRLYGFPAPDAIEAKVIDLLNKRNG